MKLFLRWIGFVVLTIASFYILSQINPFDPVWTKGSSLTDGVFKTLISWIEIGFKCVCVIIVVALASTSLIRVFYPKLTFAQAFERMGQSLD